VLFSGLDVVGSLITHSPLTILWPEREFPGAWSYWINHDGWSAWQYSSNVKLLFTVPNQAIAGWLITALIMLPLQTEKRSHSTLFLWGLSALWSPFITIGLAPVLWVGMLPERSWTALEWRRSFTIQNLIGLLFLGITALYYATKLAPIAPLLDTGFRAGFYLALIDGWISRLNYLLLLILFYVLEFGLFGWLIWRARVLSRTGGPPLVLGGNGLAAFSSPVGLWRRQRPGDARLDPGAVGLRRFSCANRCRRERADARGTLAAVEPVADCGAESHAGLALAHAAGCGAWQRSRRCRPSIEAS
jgi:hypothetical protein